MKFLLILVLLFIVALYFLPILFRWALPRVLPLIIKEFSKRAFGETASREQGSSSHSRSSHTHTASPPRRESNEKIFKKNEGEYVDFEEIK